MSYPVNLKMESFYDALDRLVESRP
jgi:hypothetical protein